MTRPTDRDLPKPLPRARLWLLRAGLGLGALLGVAAVLVLALVWRLGQGPMVLPDALSQPIVARIDAGMVRNQITIGSVALGFETPSGEAPRQPALILRDITVRDDAGLRAQFPQVEISFDQSALWRGRLAPVRATLAGGNLTLLRDADGSIDLAFAGAEEAATVDLTQTLAAMDAMFAGPVFAAFDYARGRDITVSLRDALSGRVLQLQQGDVRLARQEDGLHLEIAAQIGARSDQRVVFSAKRDAQARGTDLAIDLADIAAGDVAMISPALLWLDLLEAPLSGRLSTRIGDDGTVGDLDGQLRLGAGQWDIGPTATPLALRGMEARFAFDAQSGRLRFDALSLDAPALSFAATGFADVSATGDRLTAQLDLARLAADPAGAFDAPIALSEGRAEFDLAITPQGVRFDLKALRLVADDGEVQVTGFAQSTAQGLALDFDAQMPQADLPRLLAYWPEAALPNTRAWLAERLLAGTGRNIHASLDKFPAQARPDIRLGFDFSALDLRALREMPPLTGLSGRLEMAHHRLEITADQGGIRAPEGGVVDLAQTRFVIPDLRPRGQPAELHLHLDGAIGDVLSLLSGPPVNLIPQGGRLDPATMAKGTVRAQGEIGLALVPRQPISQMRFDLHGQLRDVASDVLVPNRRLTADTLDLSVTSEGGVVISGAAQLDGVPVTGQWQRGLARDGTPARLRGEAVLTNENLSRLGVNLPAGMITGQTPLAVEIDFPPRPAPAQMRLSSDLVGLGMNLGGLGWSKPEGRAGTFSTDVTLGDAGAVRAWELAADGFNAQGDGALDQGRLTRLNATRLEIADHIDVTAQITPAAGGVGIAVTGGAVDLRGLPQSAQSGALGGALDVRLDRLIVTPNIALSNVTAQLAPRAGAITGPFSGEINGAVPVTGTLLPGENGGTAVRLISENGGGALRAAGIVQNAYGGRLELLLVPSQNPDARYRGQLSIANPRLRDAPVMAELLNAVSVVGLLEQLVDEGINLGQVDAIFALGPSGIVLERGTAVGPSMGISMEGVYDTGARRLDMRGVLSPIYLLNRPIGLLFARRGEGLFGFNFRMQGPPERPELRVNPLSILAPGILRDLMRGAAPRQTPQPAPQPAP